MHLKSNRKYCGDLKRLFGYAGPCPGGRTFHVGPNCPGEARSRSAVRYASKSKLALLRVAGLLLAVARWWNLPHNLVTQWLVRAGRPKHQARIGPAGVRKFCPWILLPDMVRFMETVAVP